ncbi:AAA family ATPase [Aliidiomarina indica]|uniref:AAA family ATPase n=1 Tax=Aliidiomarina indica TaxID=2749147 RepID=UPI00188DCD80|nr:AAA family ATPase [Aliidiomarina indica]
MMTICSMPAVSNEPRNTSLSPEREHELLEKTAQRFILQSMLALSDKLTDPVPFITVEDLGSTFALSEEDKTRLESKSQLVKFLRKRLIALDRELNPDELAETTLEQNLKMLREQLQFTQDETDYLRFHIFSVTYQEFEMVNNLVPWKSSPQAVLRLLSMILGVSMRSLSEALKEQSRLFNYGILRFDSTFASTNLCKHELEERTAIQLLSRRLQLTDLLAKFAQRAPEAKLTEDDFSFLSQHYAHVASLLKSAVERQEKGVNILLYGPPGTGKTALTQALGQTIGFPVYETGVKHTGITMPLDCMDRLSATSSAAYLLKGVPALLVFDEAEDVFRGSMFRSSFAEDKKGWMNKFLEENEHPTIWISNDSSCMEPSVLRRFSYIVEMPNPPIADRKRLFEKMLKQHTPVIDYNLCNALVSELAEHPSITPALFDSALQASRAQHNDMAGNASAHTAEFVRDWLNQSLAAMGYTRLKERRAISKLPFDVQLINCNSIDVSQVIRGLATNQSGRICIYGPPGTGKTEYAHWLAKSLNKPIITKKASDLMSPFLGATERSIANAFREAEQDNAVLLIDEIDSFLGARQHAQRQWEISQVNELMTQLEAFDGIFIATTNRLDALDQASLRRFDLKMHFDYLNPTQQKQMFYTLVSALQLSVPTEAELSNQEFIPSLTSGDCYAVYRRHRFAPVNDWQQLYGLLRDEVGLRGVSN